MGIDCMGMGGNGNVKIHSRFSLVWALRALLTQIRFTIKHKNKSIGKLTN